MKHLFNFKLSHPNTITPFTVYPDGTNKPAVQGIWWYGLTYGYYWLNLDNDKFYEYTQEIRKYWESKEELAYVEYQISRFIEDFTSMFEKINESIPENIYSYAKTSETLLSFYEKAFSWKEANNNKVDDNNFSISDKFYEMTSWMTYRTLTAWHLNPEPYIYFFRYHDKISIVWSAEDVIENINVWSSVRGEIEMLYTDFINEIRGFGDRFFSAMEEQIKISKDKDWGTVEINKTNLSEDQVKNKNEFYKNLLLLESDEPKTQTDWNKITLLINELN